MRNLEMKVDALICDDEDMRIYSDIFHINAEIKSHSVIKQKYIRV